MSEKRFVVHEVRFYEGRPVRLEVDPLTVERITRAMGGAEHESCLVMKDGRSFRISGSVLNERARWAQALGAPPQAMSLIADLFQRIHAAQPEIVEWRFYAWLKHGETHNIGDVPKDDSGSWDMAAASLKCLDCTLDFATVSPREAFNPDVARKPPEVVQVIVAPPIALDPAKAVERAKEVEPLIEADRRRAAEDITVHPPEPVMRMTHETGVGITDVEDLRPERIRTTTDGKPPRPGFENAPTPAPLMPNGQHEAYWILSDAERAKGFVRPVRRSYRHVGRPAPKYPLLDLSEEDRQRYKPYGYVKLEAYPVPDGLAEHPPGAITGRYWTQAELDGIDKGCGAVTTMGQKIAETYAANPNFYGSTFCATCGQYRPVGADGEFVWDEPAPPSRVGT